MARFGLDGQRHLVVRCRTLAVEVHTARADGLGLERRYSRERVQSGDDEGVHDELAVRRRDDVPAPQLLVLVGAVGPGSHLPGQLNQAAVVVGELAVQRRVQRLAGRLAALDHHLRPVLVRQPDAGAVRVLRAGPDRHGDHQPVPGLCRIRWLELGVHAVALDRPLTPQQPARGDRRRGVAVDAHPHVRVRVPAQRPVADPVQLDRKVEAVVLLELLDKGAALPCRGEVERVLRRDLVPVDDEPLDVLPGALVVLLYLHHHVGVAVGLLALDRGLSAVDAVPVPGHGGHAQLDQFGVSLRHQPEEVGGRPHRTLVHPGLRRVGGVGPGPGPPVHDVIAVVGVGPALLER
ncbi:hypothetical protein GCM10007977_001240 [Dactylosporangium sucinum]|uniref:Uncharacterized protein n=1 Tax=Dactylosporangium sucinum TaxID=1424081 RepID=A0A917SZP6_9ACTN|nr:hypothetical protein GCM10007977_001240 [Dactylosporangium sucinum]